MKEKHVKTTIFSWVAAVGLVMSMPDSPLAPLLPQSVKQIGGIAQMIGVVGLGTVAADKKKED